tara:strand:+ start:647 stop:886 length:240 start_codon:yes stop_codon:yes gene_type:complete
MEKSRPTREERFKKIATRRVKEIIDKMRLLRNCANRANYSFTNEQIKKITNVIDNEWKEVKIMFKNGDITKDKKEFSLD